MKVWFSRSVVVLVIIAAMVGVSLTLAGVAAAAEAPTHGASAPSDVGLATGARSAKEKGQQQPKPRRLIVKLEPGHTLGSLIDLDALGVKRVKPIKELGLTVLTFKDQAACDAARTLLEATEGVDWVSRETFRSFSLIPNDPLYPPNISVPAYQWDLPLVGMPSAWDVSVGNPAVEVAVLDTGIDLNNPDFQGRIVDQYSVLDESSAAASVQDRFGHGTGVAGVALASGNNGYGMAGVAWNVKIMPVKLSDQGSFSTASEIEAIVYAVTHGARVINISAGDTDFSREEQEAVTYALSRRVTIVAASGNWPPPNSSSPVDYPSGFHGVISVGASDESDRVGHFSQTGWELDLVAPGVDILSYDLGSAIRSWGGTSFASPLVAGTAALMLSVDPSLTPDRLQKLLQDTTVDLGPLGFDEASGFGRLDAGAAVQQAAAHPGTWTGFPPMTFGDVPTMSDASPDSAYTPPIAILADRRIILGYGDGRFGFNDPVLRQQCAKMILLTVGRTPTADMVPPFSDVPRVSTDLYPDNYIALSAELGIVRGYADGTFRPRNSVSRAQIVTMAVRAADSLYPGLLRQPPPGYLPPFGRFNPAHDAAAAKASWNGLLDGLLDVGPGYDMLRPASRAETAAVLEKLLALE